MGMEGPQQPVQNEEKDNEMKNSLHSAEEALAKLRGNDDIQAANINGLITTFSGAMINAKSNEDLARSLRFIGLRDEEVNSILENQDVQKYLELKNS